MKKYIVIRPFFNHISLMIEQEGNIVMLNDDDARRYMGENSFHEVYIEPAEVAEKKKRRKEA